MLRSSHRDGFIALSEADWEFGPPPLKAEYEKRRSLPVPQLRGYSFTNKDDVQAMAAAFTHMNMVKAPLVQMRKHVAAMLREGELEARGLRTKPELREALEPIPRFYFDYEKIDWEKNSVANFGRRFEAVEVRRAKITEEACVERMVKAPPAEPLAKPAMNKKRGRPTEQDTISAAIKCLDEQGFDLDGDRKLTYAAILEHLKRPPDAKGFSEPVLNRCVTRYLFQKSKI